MTGTVLVLYVSWRVQCSLMFVCCDTVGSTEMYWLIIVSSSIDDYHSFTRWQQQ